MLTVGSLFAGIGGFDLGLERAGMRTVWFCEQDPYCQRVLARHWPGVPCHPDVRALVADTGRGRVQPERVLRGVDEAERAARGEAWAQGLSATAGGGGEEPFVPVPVPPVDILCGGFPCQDLSYAGRGAGIDGERSGLWREYARLIRELRPRYVIVENVPALLSRGLHVVLGDLAAIGYDAEWDCLPASAFGAPHRRDRIWIVAYPDDAGRGERRRPEPVRAQLAAAERGSQNVGDADGMARTARSAQQGRSSTLAQPPTVERTLRSGGGYGGQWATEPDVGRVAHGIPNRVDRLRALGNSLVPQIAEWIGYRIIEWEGAGMNQQEAA